MKKQIPEPEQSGFEMLGRLGVLFLSVCGAVAMVRELQEYHLSQIDADEAMHQQPTTQAQQPTQPQQPTPQAEHKSKWMDPTAHTVPLEIRTDR